MAVGRDRYGALDTWFSVTEGVGGGSPRNCFLVSLLNRNLLIPKRLHLTSDRSPEMYLPLTPG